MTQSRLLPTQPIKAAAAIASHISDPMLPLQADIEKGETSDWRVPAPPPSVPSSKAIKHYYSDAEQNLRSANVQAAINCIERDDNPADRSSNYARLAELAARLGNLNAALDLARRVSVNGSRYEEGYLDGALPAIGELWAHSDLEAALRWARTLPSPYQQSLALLGVGLGASKQ